jgi:hypothetical protein
MRGSFLESFSNSLSFSQAKLGVFVNRVVPGSHIRLAVSYPEPDKLVVDLVLAKVRDSIAPEGVISHARLLDLEFFQN